MTEPSIDQAKPIKPRRMKLEDWRHCFRAGGVITGRTYSDPVSCQPRPCPARLVAGLLFTVLAVACSDSNNSSSHSDPGVESLAAAARYAGLEVGVAIDPAMEPERRDLALAQFTSATVENALKWRNLSPAPGVYDFTDADATVELAESGGQRVRGHTLFWSRGSGTPVWLEVEVDNAPAPPSRLQALMEEHASTVVGRYAGRLQQWDVVNEPMALVTGTFDPDENIYYRVLGERYLDIAFLSAHAADSSALLYLNETFTEFQPRKFDALLQLAQRLLDRGVPLHGIGLQGHFFLRAPDAAILLDQLERIAAMGLEVELTEVDIPLTLFADQTDPLQAQADAYDTVFSACLAVHGCTGITVWGLDDAHTWLDNFFLTENHAPNRPLLFDEALQPKPAFFSVRELLSTATEN